MTICTNVLRVGGHRKGLNRQQSSGDGTENGERECQPPHPAQRTPRGTPKFGQEAFTLALRAGGIGKSSLGLTALRRQSWGWYLALYGL